MRLDAATVSFVSPHRTEFTLTAQRLGRKISLDTLTFGSSADHLTESTATRTQFVDIRRNAPRSVQLIVARPSGVLLTLTATSATPGTTLTTVDIPSIEDFQSQARSVLDTA